MKTILLIFSENNAHIVQTLDIGVFKTFKVTNKKETD